MSKGLVGLFVEMMLFSREMGLFSEALETCNDFYPGVIESVKRLLPTYPQHAGRRSEELRGLEQTMFLNGSNPRVVRAARDVITDLAGIGWAKVSEPPHWTIAEIIEERHRHHTLAHPGRGQSTALEEIG